jgi:hypothetical protein
VSGAVRNWLQGLKLRVSPPRMSDPDFGSLLFMYIPNAPERSYWECEWPFPPTGTVISISLPGTLEGPDPLARQFYLALPGRFERVVAACREPLREVWSSWFASELPEDLFSAVKLAGFGLEDARARPLRWDVGFETIGDKWLGITVPFVDDVAQAAAVDT